MAGIIKLLALVSYVSLSWTAVSAETACYSCITMARAPDAFYWQTLGFANLPNISFAGCANPKQGGVLQVDCPTDCYEVLVIDEVESTKIWARGCRATDLVAEKQIPDGNETCESGKVDNFLVSSVNTVFVQSRVCASGGYIPCNDNTEKLPDCKSAPKPKPCWKCEDAGCDKPTDTCDGSYCYNLTSTSGGKVKRRLVGCSPINLVQKNICYEYTIGGDKLRRCFCEGKECNLENSAHGISSSLATIVVVAMLGLASIKL